MHTTASLLSVNASLNDSEAIDDGSLLSVSTKATKPSMNTPSGTRSPGRNKKNSPTLISPLASPMIHRAKTAPEGLMLHQGGNGNGGMDFDYPNNIPPQGLDSHRLLSTPLSTPLSVPPITPLYQHTYQYPL